MRERYSDIDLDQLSASDRKALLSALSPDVSKYCPHPPHPKQAAFLLLKNREALFGGAAGGGKSDCLLMGALQYIEVPRFRALLLRRTFQDLSLPGALMDRTKEWLAPWVYKREITWVDKEKTFVFPNGATITFGYLESEKDKYRYQSSEFQYIAFDELTQFTETQYTYMFSRLRRLAGSSVPLRVRSATNPDGDGLEWVKRRFFQDDDRARRAFIPSFLDDNPSLDADEYRQSMMELDVITRARLLDGNWDIQQAGKLFQREWFPIISRNEVPAELRMVRYWDLASTDDRIRKKKKNDPDWTAGVLLGEYRGIYYVLDVVRFRRSPEQTETIIRETAMRDGFNVMIYLEEEPGSSGKIVSDHYARNVLKGFPFKSHHETGDKVLRANPLSSAAERGNVKLVEGPWNKAFIDELVMFPSNGWHDDQVDGISGGFRMLRDNYVMSAMPIEVGKQGSYWGGDISGGGEHWLNGFASGISNDSRWSDFHMDIDDSRFR